MTQPDPNEPAAIPHAVAAPPSRWSLPLVWLIPVVAALAGGWLAVKSVLDKGPTVTITFSAAEGIEAKKTRIRYRDIEIGTVTQVALRSDADAVVVTAELAKEAANLRDVAHPLLLPGILVNTSPTDYRPLEQLQLVRWDGRQWQRFGPVIEGAAARS